MMTKLHGFIGEVVGIHTNAVTSHQSGIELQKIPLGSCCLKHLVGIDPHLIEDHGELIHEGDVDVALGIFNDLGSFGHLDGTGPVHTGRDHQFIGLCNLLGRFCITSRSYLGDPGEGMFTVARIDPFGRKSNLKLIHVAQTRHLTQHGYAILFGTTRINGRFIDHIIAFRKYFPHRCLLLKAGE